MARAESDLQKHTLNLFRGDYERIQALYPDIGAGPIIRLVLRKFIEQCEAGTEGFDPKVNVQL